VDNSATRVGDAARLARRANIAAQTAAYYAAPKRCPQCEDPIPWKQRERVECCSQICAGYRKHGLPFSKKNPRKCPVCGVRVVGETVHCSKKCQHEADWAAKKQRLHSVGNLDGCGARTIRVFLFDTQGRVCALCGITEWQGHPAPMIADHINGDPTDNRVANLRLVCPNCDALLPTSKGRNRGRGRKKRREFYAKNGYC
jgi:hypothetical protein